MELNELIEALKERAEGASEISGCLAGDNPLEYILRGKVLAKIHFENRGKALIAKLSPLNATWLGELGSEELRVQALRGYDAIKNLLGQHSSEAVVGNEEAIRVYHF